MIIVVIYISHNIMQTKCYISDNEKKHASVGLNANGSSCALRKLPEMQCKNNLCPGKMTELLANNNVDIFCMKKI